MLMKRSKMDTTTLIAILLVILGAGYLLKMRNEAKVEKEPEPVRQEERYVDPYSMREGDDLLDRLERLDATAKDYDSSMKLVKIEWDAREECYVVSFQGDRASLEYAIDVR